MWEDQLDQCIYFCVDPELVEQVQLYVDSEDGGRSHQSQRQVVDLEEGVGGGGDRKLAESVPDFQEYLMEQQ